MVKKNILHSFNYGAIMLRKFSLGMFYLAISLSTCAYSVGQNFLQKGVTIEYDLPSNDPQVFINYMFWAIEANCKIATEDDSDVFLITALAKKGKINDIPLSMGERMSV